MGDLDLFLRLQGSFAAMRKSSVYIDGLVVRWMGLCIKGGFMPFGENIA